MKQHRKEADGKYHIRGKVFEELEGSRAKVWHGTAYKTTGGLTKHDLMKNKHGDIVSKKKHATAKREKRLEKAGYFAKKGEFGCVHKVGSTVKACRKSRKSHKSRRTHK